MDKNFELEDVPDDLSEDSIREEELGESENDEDNFFDCQSAITSQTIADTNFATLEKAEEIINLYARDQGFYFIKNKCKKNYQKEFKIWQNFICFRGKKPDEASEGSIGCSCPVYINFSLTFDPASGKSSFKATKMELKHVHTVLDSNKLHFLKKFRKLDKKIIEFIEHFVLLNPSVSIEMLKELVFSNFTELVKEKDFLWIPKDIRNIISRIKRKKRVENQAHELVSYLLDKNNTDPHFYFSYVNEGILSKFNTCV